MNNIALQLARLSSGSVQTGDNVIFDTTLLNTGGISYDDTTGVITLSQAGRYAFDWWVAIQASTSTNGAVFAISVSGGESIIGSSPQKVGQVGGFAVIEVSVPPASVSLTNASTGMFFYACAAPVKASLFVQNGLENLVDGDNTGALRGSGANSGMGRYAVALGIGTTASGDSSFAEGLQTVASGSGTHAEGYETTASYLAAHAEGWGTVAETSAAHAEGEGTRASGTAAHAEGIATIAADFASHAEGLYTNTNGHVGAHIMGRYGNADTDYSWFLANGIHVGLPGLAAKILGNGNAYIDVAWNTGGADYAEMFETSDGNPIEPGFFVTFNAGEKIRKANELDEYILGITTAVSDLSAMPANFAGRTSILRMSGDGYGITR